MEQDHENVSLALVNGAVDLTLQKIKSRDMDPAEAINFLRQTGEALLRVYEKACEIESRLETHQAEQTAQIEDVKDDPAEQEDPKKNSSVPPDLNLDPLTKFEKLVPKIPIVDPEAAIEEDGIICLIDGRKKKLLKVYLEREYDMNPDQYRKLFNLRDDYPMNAPSYVKRRREQAAQTGLGTKHGRGRR